MTPFSYVCWHDFFVCVLAWLLHTSVVTYACTWHDSRVCCTKSHPSLIWQTGASWLLCVCMCAGMSLSHKSYAHIELWRIHMRDMTQVYAAQRRYKDVTKTLPFHPIANRCDMTHIYMCHAAFMRETWLTCMLDKDVSSHYYSKQVRYHFFVCACVLSRLLHMSTMTHSFARHVSRVTWHVARHTCCKVP